MGASCCLCINFEPLKTADIVIIGGIVINAFLAWWIVHTMQKNQKNARVLKDHFIGEVKEIRNEYVRFFDGLNGGKIHAKTIIPWFQYMDIKVNDLMSILNSKYIIDKNFIEPYQAQLNALITGNIDYSDQLNSNQPVKFSEISKSGFLKFQKKYNHLFNDLIIKINDA